MITTTLLRRPASVPIFFFRAQLTLETGDRRRRMPLTPPSTSRAYRELADVPPSPSEETARRRDLQIRGSHSLHLQNFDGGMASFIPGCHLFIN